MNEKDRRGQGQRIIQERISTRAIEALMSNYRDAQQAFLELIDNAVDNRIKGEPLLVRIRATRDELSVFNKGGAGLNFEGLENFFVWGYSDKTIGKIGFYGVGGKSAMGFLGRGMEVTCSPKGSDTEYTVSDPSWETRAENEWKQLSAEEKKAASQEGYFRARVTNLKETVNPKSLITKLGDIYAPLLRSKEVTILVNGKEVEPLIINYVEDDPNLKPQYATVQTKFGDTFEMKIGVLKDGERVKPGLRCYYRGRLIEDEHFFGHPSPGTMPQASRLIGEVHLDSVPVTANKASFIHSSPQWQHAQKRLHEILAPWYAKLAKLRMENLSPVEGFEKELASKAKRILEHVFATTGIITKAMLPGQSSGRRPPQEQEPRGKSKKRKPHGSPTGRTAPTLEAGEEEVKRWGAMFKWEVVSMGNTDKRSEVVNENGRDILKINADFPLYQAEKKAGEDALELYMAETGILQIAEIVVREQPLNEYVALANKLLRDCGQIYRGKIKSASARRKSKK